tara:strand:- start:228 stop:344 length:117 start_codon:yes stop_codon:yes gene_type:complete
MTKKEKLSKLEIALKKNLRKRKIFQKKLKKKQINVSSV